MGKYSSDSDYEKRSGKRSESRKSSRRRRSDSSDSSESRSRRGNRDNRSKRTRRSRSRSREKYSKSRRSESSSRSSSRINSRYRSNRRSKSKSRDRDRRSKLRRSSSRSYIREYTSRPRKRPSSSSDSSTSSDNRNKSRRDTRVPKKDPVKPSGKINPPPTTKPEKIEAVVSATKEEMPQFDSSTLDEINSDGFAPKPFYSEKKLMENIVINLKNQTIKVPEAENKQSEEATSLFHHNLFASEEARMQKWVKELYTYRQKALQQGVRRK